MTDTLILVATQGEAQGFIDSLEEETWLDDKTRYRGDGVILIPTGIGRTNAAMHGSIALHLDGYRHVISAGFGGSLPGSDLGIGDVIQGRRAVHADIGITREEGFEDLEKLGIESLQSIPSEYILEEISSDLPARDIATVSTISGTDQRAREIARRTDAEVETMETASVAQICREFNVDCSSIVSISNTTGTNRVFDKEKAEKNLSKVLKKRHL